MLPKSAVWHSSFVYDNRITPIIITDITGRRNVRIQNPYTCTTSSVQRPSRKNTPGPVLYCKRSKTGGGNGLGTRLGENLVAKRRKINDKVVPILVAVRN